MSANTLTAALRSLGYDRTMMTVHGFRHMASTLLNESGKWRADAIERQLGAHATRRDTSGLQRSTVPAGAPQDDGLVGEPPGHADGCRGQDRQHRRAAEVVRLGREIARFEQRAWVNQAAGRVYTISLRDCGQTLYRANNPSTPKVTSAWRRVRGWAAKFPLLDAAKADYIKRGYVKLPVMGSAEI